MNQFHYNRLLKLKYPTFDVILIRLLKVLLTYKTPNLVTFRSLGKDNNKEKKNFSIFLKIYLKRTLNYTEGPCMFLDLGIQKHWFQYTEESFTLNRLCSFSTLLKEKSIHTEEQTDQLRGSGGNRIGFKSLV